MTDALSYFSAKLAHETDASDVYAAQKHGDRFILVDVRSDEAWAQGRISGAVHVRRQEIAERAPAELDPGVPVVVYCWSPGLQRRHEGARSSSPSWASPSRR